jgi:hypothetical protein
VNLACTFARTPGVIARRIAGETILVPVNQRAEDMALFTLNEVGSFVWERLDGSRPLAAIAEEITASFEVEASRASADVLEFMDLLAQVGCASEVCP